MLIYHQENILKLILTSINLFNNKYFHKALNSAIQNLIFQIINYRILFKAIVKNKTLIIGHNALISSLLEIKNSDYIVTAANDGLIKIWNKHFQCIKTLRHQGSVTSLGNLPNGLFTSCCNSYIKFWDIKDDFKCLKIVSLAPYHHYDNLTLLTDSNLALTALIRTVTNYVLILDSKSFNIIKTINSDNKPIYAVISIRNDMFAFARLWDGIKIWTKTRFNFFGFKIPYFDNYKCLQTLKSHYVARLIHVEKSNLLISGSVDGRINIWNLYNFQCIQNFSVFGGNVHSLVLLPGGFFASGLYDGSIKIWDIKSCECINTLRSERPLNPEVTSLIMLDDKRLVSSIRDGAIIIWNS
jgi:WD40 repeat protein